MKLRQLIPMLNVSDIQKSLTFYAEAFGFEIVSDPSVVSEWKWATIRSGNTELMLSESDGNPHLRQGVEPQKYFDWPCIFYFYPDNVEKFHAHLVEKGFNPTPMETTFYGMKEFSIQDPDGHMLSFGQDSGD